MSNFKPLNTSTVETLNEVGGILLTCRLQHLHTGSRLVNGIVHDDYDIVVLDPDKKLFNHLDFTKNGWVLGGSFDFDGAFASYKKYDVNVILVKTEEEFSKWKSFSEILEEAQLKDKESRIALSEFLRGEGPATEEDFAKLASGIEWGTIHPPIEAKVFATKPPRNRFKPGTKIVYNPETMEYEVEDTTEEFK
jgi:hypothetical protein